MSTVDIFLTITGLLGGIILSWLLWFIYNHVITPKIEFSKEISRSKVPYKKKTHRFQIAFKNVGSRDAFDLRIRLFVAIRDILKVGDINSLTKFDININAKQVLYLKKGQMIRFNIDIEKDSTFCSDIFDDSIQSKCRDELLDILDLLKTYRGSYIQMHLICTDSHSRSMTFYESPQYAEDDVRNGVFQAPSPIVVKPSDEIST